MMLWCQSCRQPIVLHGDIEEDDELDGDICPLCGGALVDKSQVLSEEEVAAEEPGLLDVLLGKKHKGPHVKDKKK